MVVRNQYFRTTERVITCNQLFQFREIPSIFNLQQTIEIPKEATQIPRLNPDTKINYIGLASSGGKYRNR